MASTIINCSELNVNDIKTYTPRPTGGGGKNVGMMNKRTNSGLRIQLPMLFTYGASDYEGNKNYSFGLQFPSDLDDPSSDPVCKSSLAKLNEFETYLKNQVFIHAKEWTNKTMRGPEMVDMIWSPMLRYPLKADKSEKDYTRSPSLNVKIPCWDGVWSPEVYDEEGNCLFSAEQKIGESPLPFFTKGTNVIAIIQCGGLWLVSGKVGVTWKLIQAVVKQSNTSVVGRCLIQLPETEKAKFISAPVPELADEDAPEPGTPTNTKSTKSSSEEVVSPLKEVSDVSDLPSSDDPNDVEDEAELTKPIQTKPRGRGVRR